MNCYNNIAYNFQSWTLVSWSHGKSICNHLGQSSGILFSDWFILVQPINDHLMIAVFFRNWVSKAFLRTDPVWCVRGYNTHWTANSIVVYYSTLNEVHYSQGIVQKVFSTHKDQVVARVLINESNDTTDSFHLVIAISIAIIRITGR